MKATRRLPAVSSRLTGRAIDGVGRQFVDDAWMPDTPRPPNEPDLTGGNPWSRYKQL